MKKGSFKLKFSSSNLTQTFLVLLLSGLPVFTALEANADMHEEMNSDSMSDEKIEIESDLESENSSADSSIEGVIDGKPVVMVTPKEGEETTVDVTLKNNTNTTINYQAIGHTKNRALEGGEEYTMKNLPLPVVIRSARQDDGFIKVLPLIDPNEKGILEITLDEDPQFYNDNNIGVVRIEKDGGVFIN